MKGGVNRSQFGKKSYSNLSWAYNLDLNGQSVGKYARHQKYRTLDQTKKHQPNVQPPIQRIRRNFAWFFQQFFRLTQARNFWEKKSWINHGTFKFDAKHSTLIFLSSYQLLYFKLHNLNRIRVNVQPHIARFQLVNIYKGCYRSHDLL